jgi:hypothetical protein
MDINQYIKELDSLRSIDLEGLIKKIKLVTPFPEICGLLYRIEKVDSEWSLRLSPIGITKSRQDTIDSMNYFFVKEKSDDIFGVERLETNVFHFNFNCSSEDVCEVYEISPEGLHITIGKSTPEDAAYYRKRGYKLDAVMQAISDELSGKVKMKISS